MAMLDFPQLLCELVLFEPQQIQHDEPVLMEDVLVAPKELLPDEITFGTVLVPVVLVVQVF